MISPLKNAYLVSADEEANSKTKSGILIDTSWDKYKNAVQVGVIESLPLHISDPFREDFPISIGDTAYFHHFTVQPDNYIEKDGKRYFKLNRYHLYCVVKDGAIRMVDDWILCSPIMEKEEDTKKQIGDTILYTKASPDKVKFMATAAHISKQAEEQGMKVGDTVVFRQNADYEMIVEGVEYYRMKLANAVAIIRDKELIPLRDEVIVNNSNEFEEVLPSGLIKLNFKPKREQIESIIAIGSQDEEKQFGVGDSIMFHDGTGSRVECYGKKYVVLRQEEIIGALVSA